MKRALPELLAPAGDAESLEAAIAAGADAVYFGGPVYNARMFAENFSLDAACEAVRRCAFYGVKSHIVLNILPYQREMHHLLSVAETLYRAGADAVIAADLGVAACIRRYLPGIQIHASTQLSAHNMEGVRELEALGFSRVVCARELPAKEIFEICCDTKTEIEIFVHGALCVSQSGQCLMSSIIGGRSGNRGECAQPCRLPYRTQKGRMAYALSLKDLCLAGYIPEILDLGVASLKIEGRMKNAAYVYGVTSLYRRLLDEGRRAEKNEIQKLAALFSRGGFTEGYFTNRVDSGMQGVRSDADFRRTREEEQLYENSAKHQRLLPVKIAAEFLPFRPCRLTLTYRTQSVTVMGPTPEPAQTFPLTEENVRKNLMKLGGTPFSVEKCFCHVEPGLALPISAINALRRSAVTSLVSALQASRFPQREMQDLQFSGDSLVVLSGGRFSRSASPCEIYRRQASFLRTENIPDEAQKVFDMLWLPLHEIKRNRIKVIDLVQKGKCKVGVTLPAVIFGREREENDRLMQQAAELGIDHALVGNIGHFEFVRRAGMVAHGDLRLNGYTAQSLEEWASLGLSDIVLSPELTASQLEHLQASIPKGIVIYGRIPLMTLERCVIREISDIGHIAKRDKKSCAICGSPVYLQDRRNARFLLTREPEHRNVLWNSVPIYMADQREVLQKINPDFVRFLFTDETPAQCRQILNAYREQKPPEGRMRRIRH